MTTGAAGRAATRRYERKFEITELCAREIEGLIRLHPALFSEIYAPRWINNVYFDSSGGVCLRDNLDGAAERVKVRIRWYGALRGRVEAPALEVKIKHGLVGEKDTYRLPAFELGRRFGRDEARALLARADLPRHVASAVSSLVPVLLNRYRRSYYRSADARFRLTLDTELAFLGVGRRRALRDGARPNPRHSILELKYPPAADGDADSITGWFPYRMTKSSKFVTGLEALQS